MPYAARSIRGSLRRLVSVQGMAIAAVLLTPISAWALEPGIYTGIDRTSPSGTITPMQVILGCTASPIIYHPDGMLMRKGLAVGALPGSNPFVVDFSTHCDLDGRRLNCGAQDGALGGDLVGRSDGHLLFTPASGGPGEIWARCDPALLETATPEGTHLKHVIARDDGGPELQVAANRATAPDATDPAGAARERTAELGEGIFPPGVYAQARFGSAEELAYERAVRCARQPVVFYPDGKMLGKELDSIRGEAGLPPYRVQVDALCSFTGDILNCNGTSNQMYQDQPEPLSISATVRDIGNGALSLSEDDSGGFLQCDLADLDQVVEGRNVLGEILRRTDEGPFPPVGNIALDLENYRGAGLVEVNKGGWHGSVRGTLADGAIVVAIDITQAADNPADAYGDHYFYTDDPEAGCGSELSEVACADIKALSASNPDTRGSRLVDGKLISAFAVDNSASPENLRLSIVEKQVDGTATLSIFHPDHGALFRVSAPLDLHWCDSPEGNPLDEFCITTTAQLGALADAEKARQVHGLLGTDGDLLRPFFAHVPELAQLFPRFAKTVSQPADAGRLPVGIYANLLSLAPSADWVAERCETSPTLFYPDGMVVSKVPGAESYVVDQAIQCRSTGQGASCLFENTPNGAVDVAFTFVEAEGGFQMCAEVDQFCESYHQCTRNLIAPSVYADLVARDDGGTPLTSN